MALLEKPIELNKWIVFNEPKDTMVYKGAWWDQVKFVRDHIHPLLTIYAQDMHWAETAKYPIKVIATHTSKSTVLPVYYFKAERFTIVMEANYHFWTVSIDSDIGIAPGYHGEEYRPQFFYGIPKEYAFGRYRTCYDPTSEEPRPNRQFSVCVPNKYDVYALLRNVGMNFKHGRKTK